MLEKIASLLVKRLSKLVIFFYEGRPARDSVSIEFSNRYSPLKVWILRKKSFMGFSFVGMTLGHNIFVYHHLSTWIFGHELYHVQHHWKKHGDRFLFMYLAEFIKCCFKHGFINAWRCNRRCNVYEQEAYKNQWIYQDEILNFLLSADSSQKNE